MVEGIQSRAPSSTVNPSAVGSRGSRKSIQERQKFRYLLGDQKVEGLSGKFDNVTTSTTNDNDGCATNGKLTAVAWSAVASIAVFGTYDFKRFDAQIPLIKGH